MLQAFIDLFLEILHWAAVGFAIVLFAAVVFIIAILIIKGPPPLI